MGIWVLDVVNGKPEGSPQLVSDNLNGMKPLGLTQDGSYYYLLHGRESDIYFVDLDPETGKAVTSFTKAVQNFEGLNRQPAFSPDGKRLVYVSLRNATWYYSWVSGSLVIRSLETGEERALQPNLPLVLRGAGPCWSPDGNSILVYAFGGDSAKEACWGIHQINAETGVVTPVVWNDDEQEGIAERTSPVWSPDGSKIFFMRWADGTGIRVYDLEAEREWSLDFRPKREKNSWKRALTLSPEGQQLAFVENFEDGYSFQIAPVTGGETREVLRLPKAEIPSLWLVWTPDGRYLLFGKRKDGATELWRIPVAGGEPQNLGLTMKKMEHLSIHPDGYRIAFTGPGPTLGPEVWVMENILPTSTASK